MRPHPIFVLLLVISPGPLAFADETPRATAAGGRQELVVTNQNLALVIESRAVSLPAGAVELLWDAAP
ncbi:MAG TPA: hypothetical protein VGB47_03225, partial [Thermoanaerobaculia bacterium]